MRTLRPSQEPLRLLGILAAGLAAAAAASAAPVAPASNARPASHWVASWSASASPVLSTPAALARAHLNFRDQTLREIVHLSLGGPVVRVRLSSAFGPDAVRIASAAILTPGGAEHPLTFGGSRSITIPPNATVVSDPASAAVAPGSDVAVSLFIPGPARGAGVHIFSSQTSYLEPGDQTAAPSWPSAGAGAPFDHWAFLAGVDVLAPSGASTIVALGDSITDGVHSTPNANRRWPDVLARRLAAAGRADLAVVDAGIGGNRLIQDAAPGSGVSALSRFDRDVLAQPGARYVIVLEGINDIGHSPPGSLSAADLIAGLSQLAERAHEMGLKIFAGTLTPCGGERRGYDNPERERIRQAYNDWIRRSPLLDGVVDFDRATRDPADPLRIKAAYDSGDHLHPNDAGYEAMGEAVDLNLFR